jgi:hypothetical protein
LGWIIMPIRRSKSVPPKWMVEFAWVPNISNFDQFSWSIVLGLAHTHTIPIWEIVSSSEIHQTQRFSKSSGSSYCATRNYHF